ncbi:phosphohydrolase [Paenibacillus sp. J31TS4]|uniref:NUDIX domain-containing protein n=1 Tax=Paenibacillus sp. J31TS4 TaxID=2807195 RepID=UPI001B1F8866|nr:NUDIX domain-containing protein [Paenibacillus sp. J31TS4]GIP39439.1 phosphohydrolase [Paenibacillus sp. J31TS4]
MSIRWEDSYLGQLRQQVGSRMLIAPAVRAVIENREGELLLVKRRDNGEWVMPAGGLELHESIMDCLKREVKEETGLNVLTAQLFALYTEPRFEYTNGYGDANKLFSCVFLVTEWDGALLRETDETTDAAFFPPDRLPELPALYRETLADRNRFRLEGDVIVK